MSRKKFIAIHTYHDQDSYVAMWLDGLLRMASDACRKLRSVLDFDCVGKCLEVVPATKKDLMHAQRFSPKTEDFQMQKYIPILNYSP